MAFPCNQFGSQEPGTAEEIRAFADKYGVKFPMMAKIDVNGPDTDPVFRLLKGLGGSDIRWNFFTKFVVQCGDRSCDVFRYDGAPNPSAMEEDIERLMSLSKSEEL